MAMLKGLVVVLGVLIVVALGVIAVTVATRVSAPTKPAATASASAAALTGAFGNVRVALPAGARVLETHIEGGRLVLRVARLDGSEAVLAYDLATGREAGAIELTTAPAGTK